MGRKSLYLIGGVIFLLLSSGISFSSDKRDGKTNLQKQEGWQRKYIVNQIVIKFQSIRRFNQAAIGIPSVDRLLRKAKIYQLEPIWKAPQALRKVHSSRRIENIYYAHYSGSRSPELVAREISADPNVEYAEPLPIFRISAVPNDPFYSSQRFLSLIKAIEAWDVVKGEQGEVVIAVIDGGTEINHPDLQANLWTNPDEIPDNGIDDDENGLIDDIHGWNFANKSNDPTGLDNTPINAFHGTLTAGITSAVTNNGVGVAGTSWNAKLLAVNASSATLDTTIEYGYSGILYAALEGADIISLSWGSASAGPQFAQDIIGFAIEAGAAVVAAAGNENSSEANYPSALPEVLSVAALNDNGSKASFSNYGPDIDLAAPGINIFSTSNKNDYGASSGTSFSTPIVAGVLALVKTLHPHWSGVQISEQVRVTADNIDAMNPSLVGQLGNGRVNAFRALTDTTLPSIRIKTVHYSDENGNGIIQPGETVELNLDFFNYLSPASNVNVKLSVDDSYITVLTDNSTIASIAMLSEAPLSSPLSFQVANNAPRNHKIEFQVEISVPGYNDTGQFELVVLPTFLNTSSNHIATTITNKGRIGFGDTDHQSEGIGFSFQNGPNLLFEGALIAGTGADAIVDAARSTLKDGVLQFHDPFRTTRDGDFQILNPGRVSDYETITTFSDEFAAKPLNIQITQETFAWDTPPYQDFLVFRYTIENVGQKKLENFHFGIFFDWDMDGNTYDTNITAYDAERRLGYAYDTSEEGPDTYVGVSLLSQGEVSFRAIYNDENHINNPSWGIYDGFEDEEKWEAISGGTAITSAGPADISHTLASGPHTIPAKRSLEIAFALAAGADLSALQTAVDSAKSLYKRVIPPSNIVTIPEEYVLIQNYPNPFHPEKEPTFLTYKIPEEGEVKLVIFNLLGQVIKTLVRENRPPGNYLRSWDGTDDSGRMVASGVYFYRLRAGGVIRTRKLILIH